MVVELVLDVEGVELLRRPRRGSGLELLVGVLLRIALPVSNGRRRVALRVAIDELGAGLAQPDAVVWRTSLIRGQRTVVPGPARRGGSDVSSNSDVDRAAIAELRPGRGTLASRI